MEWAKPLFSRTKVKQAGKLIAAEETTTEDYEIALDVVDNWRSAHSFPLNTVQVWVRRMAKHVDPAASVVQRLKRLPSIKAKLLRQPNMALTMMNDIGGCRAVLSTIDEVRELNAIIESRRASVLRDAYDYITTPKADGYRSVHLPLVYKGRRTQAWDGLRIEVQVRTQLQHSWATAVEVVALFTGQRLKWNLGEPDWKRFFVLMGSAIARREGSSPVPGCADEQAGRRELRVLAGKLDVERRLSAYSVVADMLNKAEWPRGARYHLLKLDIAGRTLTTQSFKQSENQQASFEYAETERATLLDPYVDVVLVAVESLAELKRAYPNYFADTEQFRAILAEELR